MARDPSVPTPKRRGRLKIALLVVTTAIVLLVLTVAAVLLINPSFVARHVTERVLPRISERIGRPVLVQDVRVSLFPPSAKLTGVQVSGAPGEPAFVQAREASAGIELWPLIKSRGQEVRVDSVRLSDVDVNLVRRADGTWSHDDIKKRLHETAPPASQQQPDKGSAQVQVSEITLENGRLHLVDGSLPLNDPNATATLLDRLGVTLHDVGPGLPLTMELSGALASDQPNLKAKLTVDPLPADPAALTPEQYPTVQGSLSMKGVQLERFSALLPAQTDALLSGGLVTLDAQVGTDAQKRYAVTGNVNLKDLRLRGQPANGSFTLATRYDPRRPEAIGAQLSKIRLQGPGVDLSGNAALQENPRRVQFALEGPLLDLDALLAALPPKQATTQPKPLVPPSLRREVAGLKLDGTLKLGELRSGKLSARNLQAHTTIDHGVLTLTKGEAELYTGKVTLDGSSIDLRKPKPVWALKANLQAVDLGNAFQSIAGEQPLQGLLSGALNLTGEGNLWTELQRTLTGTGAMSLVKGALTTANLGGQLTQQLAPVLQLAGQGQLAQSIAQGKGTTLKDLAAQFDVSNGALHFKNPVKIETPFGSFALGGRVGLDSALDLQGAIAVPPQVIASLTGNQLKPDKPVQVPLELTGSLRQPQITGIDAGAVAQQLVMSSAPAKQLQQQQKQLEKNLENEARRRLNGFLGK